MTTVQHPTTVEIPRQQLGRFQEHSIEELQDSITVAVEAA